MKFWDEKNMQPRDNAVFIGNHDADLVSLADAARMLGVSLSLAYSWTSKGVRGHKLSYRCRQTQPRLWTSRAALRAFFEATGRQQFVPVLATHHRIETGRSGERMIQT